jgi:pseudouridine synthase
LARAGVSSRRKAEEIVRAGRVRLNGRVVTELGTRMEPGRDRLSLDNKAVVAEPTVHLVLNKPEGVVCSAAGVIDERGRPTVLSLVRGVRERIYPIGRLDYNTRGVLLLTNDGELAAVLTHPRHRVPKTYHVKFRGLLELEDLERLAGGVELDDGTRTEQLDEIFVIRQSATNTWVQLTLRQGRNRQVRRMGDAIGRAVVRLIRVAVGDITTDGLAPGEFRRLTRAEVEALRAFGAG